MIQSEYNGEMAQIKVMVDTGNVDWDVVQMEGPDLMRGCEEGMYERLDWTPPGPCRRIDPRSCAGVRFGRAGVERGDRPTTPTNWPRPPPHGQIYWDMQTNTRANAACANARCTTWSSRLLAAG